tara:strand:- start:2227 stop:2877 length:651 start_codon:yes stop_codon:yes gene_type:complete
MNQKVYTMLEEILSEGDWNEAQEEANEFIRHMRREGAHAADDPLNNKLEEDDDSNEDSSSEKEEETKDSDDDEEEVETKQDLQKIINLGDARNFEKLVDLLNRFRASKSLTDEDVNEELSSYFERLSDTEKDTLYVLIKGLVQITQQDVSGKAANTPADMMFNISKSGAVSSEKAKSMLKKQKSKEEAEKSSLTPIKIGENIQEKKDIIAIVKSNV